jgi:adenine-specific DNA-methyltransferase
MSTVDLRLGDALEILPTLADNSADLILTDPPYYRVKDAEWDRQWATRDDYLAWLDTALAQFARVLKPNGSLYVFAGPQMAAHVEVLIGRRFNVLNHIVWPKSDEATHALKYGDDRFRQYVQKSERIIFAEHFGADNIAKGEAGYAAKCDDLRGFIFEPLRAYLDGERRRAGITSETIHEAWCEKQNSKGRMVGHWFGQSQWSLPTEANYQWLRECFARLNHGGDYLRREYEDLRREYEDLRRPFTVSADVPYTDVWTFPTVSAYPGKHPCEKPAAMMEHIIRASSRQGAVVLDAFMGSGAVGIAALKLGRSFIGIEIDPGYFDIAKRRIDAAQAQPALMEATA